MNFCNKHQMHYEVEKECRICTDGIPNHWPHQPSSEQLTLELIQHTEGIKHDQSKPDLSLIPAEFSAEVARGFMYGANKYGRFNYLNGMDWHRIIAAVKRHVDAFQEGEDLDPESGVTHLGHAACGLAMLLVYYKRGLGTDTRYKGRK